MDTLKVLLDIVLHLNKHLDELVAAHGAWWIYGVVFLIVFCETGLVATPFLPGDSLLFALGALAGGGSLDFWMLGTLLFLAAVLGDSANYGIGKFAGRKMVEKFPRMIKPEYMKKTHEFYERYGGKTIILARFVPIVRTFAPFVAGIGTMTYRRFMMFNLVGALLWVFTLLPLGYFFGNIPVVKKNFSMVILVIIFLSLLPGIIEGWREWTKSKGSRVG